MRGSLIGILWRTAAAALLLGVCIGSLQPATSPSPAPAPAPAPAAPAPAETVFVNATTLAQSCAAACAGGACAQSNATGVVSACLGCPAGRGGPSCADLSGCADLAWCASADVDARTLPLHNALVGMVLFNSTSTHLTLPFVGPQPPSIYPNWTQVFPALGATPAAVLALLNRYLDGRSVTPQSVALWFDDQTGWWRNQSALYLASIPTQGYTDYLAGLKAQTCAQRWHADTQSGACAPPPF